ncbi:M20 family metallopeptidase [Breoghania sp.]|uniref:M20 family metallopeptidase n=1 Tax=Breoghania sp. TaxID=2065378 RepID=UPI002AAA6307|nr:M20 family metallopeptidase [Breoghania sp.]
MDVTELTRKLIAFDTINPPGDEAAAMAFLKDLLEGADFECRLVESGDRRCSLVATKGLSADAAALAFTGHLDTVPLGDAPWVHPPHAGVVENGRLHGRGSADMKGGVAAFLCAVLESPTPPGGIVLLLTGGEETGSDGAKALVEAGGLPKIGALVVAEPTDNRAVPGHKGALWLRLKAHGVTSHGSMPQEGVNAVMGMAHALVAIEGFVPGPAHPVMGLCTSNVGTIRGGLNTNSVPDYCEVALDMRSVAGAEHASMRAALIGRIGTQIEIETIIDLPAVWTDPQDPWIASITAHAVRLAGADPAPSCMPYFTDASVFTPALDNVPTIILGPGEAEMAHKTDESVSVLRLQQAQAIYSAAIADWTGALS